LKKKKNDYLKFISERKHIVEDSKTLKGVIIIASINPAFMIDEKYLNDI
jgi:hypothetical protein